jgi:hypothetical protein
MYLVHQGILKPNSRTRSKNLPVITIMQFRFAAMPTQMLAPVQEKAEHCPTKYRYNRQQKDNAEKKIKYKVGFSAPEYEFDK